MAPYGTGPYAERMYISPVEKKRTEYGNEDDAVSMWSAGLKTFIFQRAVFTPFLRGRPQGRKPPPCAGNWIADYASERGRGAFVRLISIRVLGLDTAPDASP